MFRWNAGLCCAWNSDDLIASCTNRRLRKTTKLTLDILREAIQHCARLSVTKWPSDFGDLIPKGNQDIDLRDLYVTSAPQRELEFRSDAKFLKAAMLYRRGDAAARPCTRCALGNGQYQE